MFHKILPIFRTDLELGFHQTLRNTSERYVLDNKSKNVLSEISLFQEHSNLKDFNGSNNILFIRSISAVFPNLSHSALKSVAIGKEYEIIKFENENENENRKKIFVCENAVNSNDENKILNVESNEEHVDVAEKVKKVEKVDKKGLSRSISRLIVQSLFSAYCDMKKIENENKSKGNYGQEMDCQDKCNESGSPISHSTESSLLVQSAGCCIVLLAYAEAEANHSDDECRSAGAGRGIGGVERGSVEDGRTGEGSKGARRPIKIGGNASSASLNLTEAVLEITQALQSESSTSILSEAVFLRRMCAAHLLTVLVQSLLSPSTFSSSSSSSSSSSPSSSSSHSSIPLSVSPSVTHQPVDGLRLLLRTYELFLAAALYGMGDFEPYVRVQCGTVLRMLVPLAPIARERTVKFAPYLPILTLNEDECSVGESRGEKSCNSTGIRFTMTQQEKMSKLIENLLSRKPLQRLTESTDPLDVYLVNELASKTHLLPILNSFKKPYKKTSDLKGFENILNKKVSVRPYQWDGVSWLLQLYRCGLGGILAGGIPFLELLF